MEAVISSTATAEKQMTPEEGRADLLKLFSITSLGGRMDPERFAFCSCCGSQFLREDGLVKNGQANQWLGVEKEDVEKDFNIRYGPDWKTRASSLGASVIAWSRKDKPGVTFAYMDKDKAIEILYSEPLRKLADGYNIIDDGTTYSVVWLMDKS